MAVTDQYIFQSELEKAIRGSSKMNPSEFGFDTGLFGPSNPVPLFGLPTQHTMLYHASVEKAENGYILKIQHQQNGPTKQYVAATTEELQKVFIAAIVAERISK